MSGVNMVPPAEQSKAFQVSGWRLALERAPLFLSVVLLFILPFITQLQGTDSIYVKTVLAQVIVFLMLGAWALKVNVTGALTTVYTWALWPLAALAFWLVINLSFSSYANAGWEAFISLLYLPLWYLLLTQTNTEVWKAENLLITFLMGALGSCLWGLAQAVGFGGGAWLTIVQQNFQGRITAGLGNPDFFAGYLLMVWPIALALLLRAQSTAAKILWGFILASSLICLILTQSKAGWLGLVAGFLIYVAFFLIGSGQTASKRKWFFGLAVLLVFITFLSPLKERFSQLSNPQNDSVTFRKEVWKGTWTMIEAHPWMGTGFGTYQAAFPPYRTEALMLKQTQRSYQVDHAHNWLLEWTAEEGFVGLALLLAFWAAVVAQWWRLYKANAIPRALGAGAFAAFEGVAVDNFFDINASLPSTLIPLFFLAALPVALSARFAHLPGFPVRFFTWNIARFRVYLAPVTLLVVILMLNQINRAMMGQLADIQLKQAESLSEQKAWDQALPIYNNVIRIQPSNLAALYFRGSVYLDRGNPDDLPLALADFTAVQKWEPDYVLVHYKLSQVYAKMGKEEAADSEMTQAVKLDPELIFQEKNFLKAETLVSQRLYKEALPLYQKLVLDYPACVPLLINTANCMVERGLTDQALRLYDNAIALDPENIEALLDEAAVAVQVKDEARATKAVRALMQLEPGNGEVLRLEEELKTM